MSLNPDGQKSVEAIRARAQELASGETQRQGTRHAELLATLADGTVFFKDVPDDELERGVGELGADAVVDALMAFSGPARSAACVAAIIGRSRASPSRPTARRSSVATPAAR